MNITAKIIVYHIYQDKDNPHTQEITIDNGVDFAYFYAIFRALIESKFNFEVQ